MPRPRMSFSIEELHGAVDTLIRNQDANAVNFERSAKLSDSSDRAALAHTAETFRQQAAKSQELLGRLERAWDISETLEVS